MVVAAGRQEQDVAGGAPAWHAARLHYHVEAKHIDVEGAYPINVGGSQMDVPNGYAWVDWAGGRCARHNIALRLVVGACAHGICSCYVFSYVLRALRAQYIRKGNYLGGTASLQTSH